MPSKYFPFDSTFTGVDSNGIPQGDRGASSANWAGYVSRMFSDGYFKLLDDQLDPSISATPMAVDIAAGSAMIKGRQYSQDETVTVSLGFSDSQPRIDRIVLRMSTEVEDRKIYLKVLKGTPAASPMAPDLTRTASVYDICLAEIAVGANVVQIVEDDLTDTRNDEVLCGYVKILLDGRYYPEGSIPELLWVYSMYPETLTPEQKAFVEGDAEFMSIYESSKIRQVDIKTIKNKLAPGTIAMFMGDGVPDGFLYANGAELSQETYPELYAAIKNKYGSVASFASWSGTGVRIGQYEYIRNGYFSFMPVDIQDDTVYAIETGLQFALSSPFTGGDSQGQFGLAIVDDKYYTIGGETVLSGSGTAVKTCKKTRFIDKTTVTTWANMPDLPIARSNTAIAVYNNKYIYSIGGQPSHGNMSGYGNGQVEVYRAEILSDGALSSWTAVTPLSTALTATTAIILGNKLYVLGGATAPNGMSDPYCVQEIKVATIEPITGILSAWSTYGVSLPTATKAYGVFARIMEGKIFILQNNTWYSATISDDGFSTFTTVSGWSVNNPASSLWYNNGYLYDLAWDSSSSRYVLRVRKYVDGVFNLITSSATLGSRTLFKIPDLRSTTIKFASGLTSTVASSSSGGLYTTANVTNPIPCLKY